MVGKFRIRAATMTDLPRLTEIYNHYVTHTTVTFDIKPYSVEERSAWFGQFGRNCIAKSAYLRVLGACVS